MNLDTFDLKAIPSTFHMRNIFPGGNDVKGRLAGSAALRQPAPSAPVIDRRGPGPHRIEAAVADASLDLMFRGLFALGGRLADLVPAEHTAGAADEAPAAAGG